MSVNKYGFLVTIKDTNDNEESGYFFEEAEDAIDNNFGEDYEVLKIERITAVEEVEITKQTTVKVKVVK